MKNQKYTIDNIGDGYKAEVTYANDDTSDSTKNVLLIINPKLTNKNERYYSLCKTLLGIYVIVLTNENNKETRLMIHALVPNGPAYKSRKLRIGDLLVSINDFHVNADNIESLLNAIKEPKSVRLTVQSPINYIKLNGNHKANIDSTTLTATCKNVNVVQGTRLKETHIAYDFPYMALILSLNDTKQNLTNENIDVVYKYPQQDDIFLMIHSLFTKLALGLRILNNGEVQSCTICHQKHVMTVKFIVDKTNILVIAIPKDRLNDYLFEHLVKDLNVTIQFSCGSLGRIVEDKMDTAGLDVLFSLYFQRMLLNKQLINMKSIRYSDELNKRIFNAIPLFELPDDIKLNIDAQLTSFEAQEFIDADGKYFKFQRYFDIIGCCLFFKTYLVQTHLNMALTLDMYKYFDNIGLLILSSNNVTKHIEIWKEVFIKNKKHHSLKHFLLIIGHKDFLLAVLVEFGEISRRAENGYNSESPDPLIVDQTKLVIHELSRLEVFKDIGDWHMRSTLPKIVNPDRFLLKHNEKQNISKNDIIDYQTKQKKSSSENLTDTLTKKSSSFENDSGETSQRTESHNKTVSYKSLDDFHTVYQNFPDSYFHDRVFSYILSEEGSNGVLISPTKTDIDLINSILYEQLTSRFTECCIKIKKFFDHQAKIAAFLPSTFRTANYIEQGVLFKIHHNLKKAKSTDKIDDDSKKRSKSLDKNENRYPNCVSFWVVGRRICKPFQKDFFICFHDSADNIIQELAFDICFNRGAL